jgi:exonuclease III
LKTFTNEFDFIILSELWANFKLSPDKDFPGYNYIYNLNNENKAGGIAIYYKSCLFSDEMDLKNFSTKHLDIIGLTIQINNLKCTIVGIYNHINNNIQDFSKSIDKIIANLQPKELLIIAGNFNINIEKYNIKPDITEWTDKILHTNSAL